MVQHSPSLSAGQLVCVTQYYPPVNGAPQTGPALAVGHMALPGDQVWGNGKGKAVNIVHTWKDHLWVIGGKEDPPVPRVIEINQNLDPEVNDKNLPGGIPDPTIESAPERTEGSSTPMQSPATPPNKELNPLSQQGIFPSGVVPIF